METVINNIKRINISIIVKRRQILYLKLSNGLMKGLKVNEATIKH